MRLALASGRRKSPPSLGASPLSPEATSILHQSYNFQSFSTFPCLLFQQQQASKQQHLHQISNTRNVNIHQIFLFQSSISTRFSKLPSHYRHKSGPGTRFHQPYCPLVVSVFQSLVPVGIYRILDGSFHRIVLGGGQLIFPGLAWGFLVFHEFGV